jgi:hypothetical protein
MHQQPDDLTLAEVLRKAGELAVNEDGDPMFQNIPEEEDLAILDPSLGGEAHVGDEDVNINVDVDDREIGDDDLELLDLFEAFDDEALASAMQRQRQAVAGTSCGGNVGQQQQRAFTGLKQGFLVPTKQPAQSTRPTTEPPPKPTVSVVGDVHERSATSSTSAPAPTTSTSTKKEKPLSKFKRQVLHG